MIKLRPRQKTIYLSSSSVSPLTLPPSLMPPGVTGSSQPTTVESMSPSAFQTTVAASGSIALICLTFSLSLGVSPQFVPLVACLPWVMYAIGKSIYLVMLLVSDIVTLFGGDESPKIIPTIKED